MEMLKLVYLQMLSHERDKYIWEDLYSSSWDEIIGRVYLLKLHLERYQEAVDNYERALTDYDYWNKAGLIAASQRRQPDWDNL